VILRASAVWLLLCGVAIGNGAFRQAFLLPRLGDQAAHVLGTLIGTTLFAVVVVATLRWVVPALEPGRLVALGVGWTLATIAFEFGFGHYVAGHPWPRLLADYDVSAGRIWVLVLLVLLLLPPVAGRWMR